MKHARLFSLAVLVVAISSPRAQVIITSSDMFNQIGEWYLAYSNARNDSVPVDGLIGEEGGPHFWDFTSDALPKDETFRFDYIDPSNTVIGNDFPDATIAERKTEEGTGNMDFILFSQEPGIGRQVYGFWSLEFENPSTPFAAPINDWPAQIRFEDTWSSTAVYENTIFGVPIQISRTSTMEVDAYGLIEMPQLGFGDVLRVNELVETGIAMDINGTGTFTNVDRQFLRNIYFLRPDHGVAVHIASEPSANPPSTNFNVASYLIRMFETNKTPAPGCEGPAPVEDLRISLSDDRALLKWTEVECVARYIVQYRHVTDASDAWTVLGETNDNFMLDEVGGDSPGRLYRVVSQE